MFVVRTGLVAIERMLEQVFNVLFWPIAVWNELQMVYNDDPWDVW